MRLGWLRAGLLPDWLRVTKALQPKLDAAELRKQELAAGHEVPLLFVEVDPAAIAPEPPKDAKYYSAKNSVAANPDIQLDTPKPKLDGSQTKVPRTSSAPRSKPMPLQPAPTPPPKEEPPSPPPPKAEEAPKPLVRPETAMMDVKPEGGPSPGDLSLTKPEKQPGAAPRPAAKEPIQEARVRPRTLADARQQKGLPGERMKQEGGVKRRALMSSLDVKATPFGSYDAEIIAAIQQRWYDLLDTYRGVPRTGKVVLDFHLMTDGRITHLKMVENGVSEMLELYCEKAILDPSPYRPWPTELRRLIKGGYREVRFTFYYD